MPRAFADFGLSSALMTPRAVLAVQTLNAHDIASVVVLNTQLPYKVTDGMPVSLTWGYEFGAHQNFYGYVHHVEPMMDDASIQRTKVVCIGATFPLRQNMRRTWSRQSVDSIVREVAAEFYLSVEAEPHPVVWPFISCAGSAWEFLTGLAAKVGYILTGNRTELRFLPVSVAVGRSVAMAPMLTLGSNLIDFRPVVGAPARSEQTIRVSHGVDPRTGMLFTSMAQPTALLGPDSERLEFFSSETGVVADTPNEAAVQLAGLAEKHQFVHEATVEAAGDVSVVQGVVVYIDGVADDYAGYWFVKQVEHVVQGEKYTMHLQLGRDSRGAYGRVGPSAGAGRRIDPYGTVAVDSPPTMFLNGNWRSGWARRAG